MSYVEHCNKHGQYKGDYCGECVEELEKENKRLKESLTLIARTDSIRLIRRLVNDALGQIVK